MNGGDGSSGSMHYGGTREEGIGVPTGARAMIFVADGNSKKTTNPKRRTRNQQEKHKQRQKSAIKALTTGGLLVTSQQAKRAEQKEAKPHETSRNNTSNKHDQHKQQKYWHTIFVKKQQKSKIKNMANVKQQDISFTMPKQQVEWGGKGERKKKTDRINSATTQQTRARKMRLPYKYNQTHKIKGGSTQKKHITNSNCFALSLCGRKQVLAPATQHSSHFRLRADHQAHSRFFLFAPNTKKTPTPGCTLNQWKIRFQTVSSPGCNPIGREIYIPACNAGPGMTLAWYVAGGPACTGQI